MKILFEEQSVKGEVSGMRGHHNRKSHKNLPETAAEVKHIPHHVHSEADETSVGNHSSDREELENGQPSTNVLSATRGRALVELSGK